MVHVNDLNLKKTAILFFDILTSLGLKRQDTYSIEDREDGVLILGIVWEPSTCRSTMKITSFVPADRPGLYERASETITEWGQPVAGIYDRLKRAGFSEPERPWTNAEDPEAEERLAVLARRK